MKRRFVFSTVLLSLFFLIASCDWDYSENYAEDTGKVYLKFSDQVFRQTFAGVRSSFIPDTAIFVLKVTAENGEKFYDGYYGERPEMFELPRGVYSFSVVSSVRSMPEFDLPLWGDGQSVHVEKDISLTFMCRQLNSAVRLNVAPELENSFPYGYFNIISSGSVTKYGYEEDRYLFLDPGELVIEFVKSANSRIEILRRYLSEGEMVTFLAGTGASGVQGTGGISIMMDTSRVWSSEYLDLSDIDNKGKAVPLDRLASMAGEEDVWTSGYIVGGDLSSSSVKTSSPFKSMTNLAIASSPYEKDKKNMISVELPSGSIRDELNLVSNPENLGRKVWLRGDVSESYFGITGIKKTDRYEW